MRKKKIAIFLILLLMLAVGCQAGAGISSTTEQNNQFVGSVNSDKYHYPDCRSALNIKQENEVWFSSVEDAKSKGYVACKVCKPQ